MKHEGRWHHQLTDDPQYPPGTILITSPTGHVYASSPPAIGPTAADLAATSAPGAVAGGPGVAGAASPEAGSPTDLGPKDPGPPPF
jgi:hypothetical protein